MGEREANWILILHFHMFDIERQSGQGPVENPLIGLTKRTAQFERTGDGRVAGGLAAQIMAPKRIEIKLIHLKRQVSRITIAQLNVPTEQQRTLLQMRITGDMKLASLRDRLQVEFAGEFMIESQVAHMDIRIDGRSFGSAGAFEDEIGAAFHGETTGINLRDFGEIEIVSGKIEAEGTRGRIVGCASSND